MSLGGRGGEAGVLLGLSREGASLAAREDYHSRLHPSRDKELKTAIERVIRIFKSRLFQALLGESSSSLSTPTPTPHRWGRGAFPYPIFVFSLGRTMMTRK